MGVHMLRRLVLQVAWLLLAVSAGFPVAAQQLSPDFAQCVNQGGAFSPDEQISGCTAVVQSSHELSAIRAIAYINRGVVHWKRGDHDRGIADFSEAIALDPVDLSSWYAYFYRGEVYTDKKDYHRAIADYSEAIRLHPLKHNPSYASFHTSRALAYLKAGKAAQGLPDAERSLQLRPDDARTLDTRGHIYEALGRHEEAIADFRRVLSLAPQEPELQASSREALKRVGATPY
jgi:tetratricopeptide (TPR) repeat protein